MINTQYVTRSRDPFFAIAKKYINPESLVLDIGAADGQFASFCGRNDFHLLDGNDDSVALLKRNYPNACGGLLPNLPYPDDFFDLIHCSHVIEHLSPDVLYQSLKEMDRCLKSSGYIVISAPVLHDAFYNDLSHVRPYTQVVVMKYLCHCDVPTQTRPPISERYSMKELEYRYKEIPITHALYNTRGSFVVMLLMKAISMLHRLGLRRCQKTGYTLVLQKNTAFV